MGKKKGQALNFRVESRSFSVLDCCPRSFSFRNFSKGGNGIKAQQGI